MSKKVEDSELQTLTLSPTNTNDDESSPFVNPASDETAFPISPPPSYSSVVGPLINTFVCKSVDDAKSNIYICLFLYFYICTLPYMHDIFMLFILCGE